MRIIDVAAAFMQESITPSTAPRSINFEYMTRQLLWDGLMVRQCYHLLVDHQYMQQTNATDLLSRAGVRQLRPTFLDVEQSAHKRGVERKLG
jgi:hypothetical protein